ncbi:hypothetical protein LZG04_21990 [Saccharothrix sp. S26]|uniref:hypothetical protein n=1 Tax=Saccharothrix sp. S26 TaxID=2907215 RepID=UPI001F26E285|nr:hypothetical protein [Saccharothrix sp. S26]MCE6997448.1 hypothetical protein [Saccharothrix sp. S26]
MVLMRRFDVAEAVRVVAEHRPPSLDQPAAFLRDRGLSRRKLPERLVVLPELPLGHTGKVCLPTVTRSAAMAGEA